LLPFTIWEVKPRSEDGL